MRPLAPIAFGVTLLAFLAFLGCERASAPPATTGAQEPAKAAASPAPPAAASSSAAPVERARAAVAKLKGTLMAELQKAIAERGAAGAVDVCGAISQRVKEEASVDGITIGRTSSRLRNPANTAPSWVAPILAELERAPKDQRQPRQVALPDGAVGYVEPLVTAPLCLQCHGKDLAPDVKAALAAKYPDDKATGFAEGDLRGVAWVEVRTPPEASTPR